MNLYRINLQEPWYTRFVRLQKYADLFAFLLGLSSIMASVFGMEASFILALTRSAVALFGLGYIGKKVVVSADKAKATFTPKEASETVKRDK